MAKIVKASIAFTGSDNWPFSSKFWQFWNSYNLLSPLFSSSSWKFVKISDIEELGPLDHTLPPCKGLHFIFHNLFTFSINTLCMIMSTVSKLSILKQQLYACFWNVISTPRKYLDSGYFLILCNSVITGDPYYRFSLPQPTFILVYSINLV